MKRRLSFFLFVIVTTVLLLNGCRVILNPQESDKLQLLTTPVIENVDLHGNNEEDKTEVTDNNETYNIDSFNISTELQIYKKFYNGTLNITIRYDEQNREFYGVVDADGNTLIECNYSAIGILSEDRIVAHVNLFNWENQFARIFDNRGNIISDGEWKEINFIYKKQGGSYPVGQGTCYIPYGLEGVGYYLIDHDGKKIIETKFDYINLVSDWETHLIVDENGETYVIDLMGNRIDSLMIYENFHNSTFIKTIHLNENGVYDAYGVVDAGRNTIIECIYDDLYMVNGDRIIAHLYNDDRTDSAAYIFDLEGKPLSDGEWRSIESTPYNAVIGKDYIPDGEEDIGYYLIDYNGDKIISTRFDKIFPTHKDYPNGDFAVTINNETYDIDSMGNRIDV